MAAKLLTLLFIVPIVYARIEIDISSANEKERDVRVSGSYVDAITDADVQTFELTDENLKKSIASYFGWTPDSVYLKSPTPWGGLYKSLNWEPVNRVFSPKEATILSVETKPVLISTKNLINEDSKSKTFEEEIEQLVETEVSSKWNKNFDLRSEDIHYSLSTEKAEGPMYFGFTAKSGDDVLKTSQVNVASRFEVTLQPKQKAKVIVVATKEIMKIRVDYETSLMGNAAVNYEKKYKGHRFWAMDIGTILEAGGLRKSLQSSELIDVVHFKDAKVLVKDVETDDVIYTASLEML